MAGTVKRGFSRMAEDDEDAAAAASMLKLGSSAHSPGDSIGSGGKLLLGDRPQNRASGDAAVAKDENDGIEASHRGGRRGRPRGRLAGRPRGSKSVRVAATEAVVAGAPLHAPPLSLYIVKHLYTVAGEAWTTDLAVTQKTSVALELARSVFAPGASILELALGGGEADLTGPPAVRREADAETVIIRRVPVK